MFIINDKYYIIKIISVFYAVILFGKENTTYDRKYLQCIFEYLTSDVRNHLIDKTDICSKFDLFDIFICISLFFIKQSKLNSIYEKINALNLSKNDKLEIKQKQDFYLCILNNFKNSNCKRYCLGLINEIFGQNMFIGRKIFLVDEETELDCDYAKISEVYNNYEFKLSNYDKKFLDKFKLTEFEKSCLYFIKNNSLCVKVKKMVRSDFFENEYTEDKFVKFFKILPVVDFDIKNDGLTNLLIYKKNKKFEDYFLF